MTTPTDAAARSRILELLASLAAGEGTTRSLLDGVTLGRVTRSLPRAPIMYEPCICLVLQGRKRAHFGDAVYVYDAQQFLVVSTPLSLECETLATEAQPLLGMILASTWRYWPNCCSRSTIRKAAPRPSPPASLPRR